MKFFHFVVIALTVTCLFGIVHSIHTREIVDFPSDTTDYSYSGYIYHTAHLKTDVPFYCVWWYVDGNYAGWSNEGESSCEY